MSLQNNQQGFFSMPRPGDDALTDLKHSKQPYISAKECSPLRILNSSQKRQRSNDRIVKTAQNPSKTKYPNKSRKKRAKDTQSSNHNFQKHTVTTVRKLGEQLTQTIGFSQIDLLAKRIWLIFLSSDINSKKMLLILFGKANLKNEECKILFRECYLGQICSYEEIVVQEVQNTLRRSFLLLVDDDLVRFHTKKIRNIYNKEEFIAYFLQFIQELKKGPFVRSRINDATKRKIQKRARAQKRLSRVKTKRNKTFVYQQLQ